MLNSRWITGQEIINCFNLQIFELVNIMSITKTGMTPTGKSVGYTAYLVQLIEILPITRQHIGNSKLISIFDEHKKLAKLQSENEANQIVSDDGEKLFFYNPSDTTQDEILELYYALTPDKYKTENGIDEELFYNDLPVFIFSRDEYNSIKALVEKEGLTPETISDSSYPADVPQSTENGTVSKCLSPADLLAQFRGDGVTDLAILARKLKDRGVFLKEIGRLLRKDGEFDSDDANIKRATRLLSN